MRKLRGREVRKLVQGHNLASDRSRVWTQAGCVHGPGTGWGWPARGGAQGLSPGPWGPVPLPSHWLRVIRQPFHKVFSAEINHPLLRSKASEELWVAEIPYQGKIGKQDSNYSVSWSTKTTADNLHIFLSSFFLWKHFCRIVITPSYNFEFCFFLSKF